MRKSKVAVDHLDKLKPRQHTHGISMSMFFWSGYNNLGQKVSGQLIGEKEQDILDQIAEQGVHIVNIYSRPLSVLEKWKYKPNRKDIFVFTHQLATMLDTGVPILSALKILIENQSKLGNKILIFRICKQLENGYSLSDSFRHKHPLFDDFFCDLVLTGEQTGKLSDMLFRIAAYQEKTDRLRKKAIKAMIYPCVISAVAFGLTLLMMVLVIPEFEQMFQGFNTQLPWLTDNIIKLSRFIIKFLWLILIIPCAIVFFIHYRLKNSTKFQVLWAQNVLNIPIFGEIMTKVAIAKFNRTFATGLMSGIHISQALLTSAKTVDNLFYQRAFEQVNSSVSSGTSIYIAMKNSQIFPEMMLQMIMIGETSGRLDDILNKIASIYESEVDTTVDNLGQLLEPIILIFLGGIVGTLVVALYLPIFNLVAIF